MTNTEIKEVIEILKKEGCNSKKQAIEYLEKRLEPDKLSEILAKIKDKDFFIIDLEKRKVIQRSYTLSFDNEWIRHIEETIFYELDIEMYSNNKIDIKVLTFKTLEALKKAEQFIKDNCKFLKKGGKI